MGVAAQVGNEVRESVRATVFADYQIDVPTYRSAPPRSPRPALDKALVRARAILEITKKPSSAEDIFRKTANIPMSSIYYLLNSMVRLGWLRVFSRPNSDGKGNRTKLYVSVETADTYPRMCATSNHTVYSEEMEASHRCR